MGPKEKRKLNRPTVELKKEVIAKHESGVRVCDLRPRASQALQGEAAAPNAPRQMMRVDFLMSSWRATLPLRCKGK